MLCWCHVEPTSYGNANNKHHIYGETKIYCSQPMWETARCEVCAK